MPAVVTPQPVAVGRTAIVNGAAVDPTDWQAIANAYNGLVGMGSALIPMSTGNLQIAPDDTVSPQFRVWPRYAATHRLWVLSFDLAQPAAWTFTDPSGGTRTFRTSALYGKVITHVETIAARTSSETTLEVTFHPTGGAGGVTGIACIELPRGALAIGAELPTGDGGLEPAFIRTGLPITDDYTGNGIGFVARELDKLREAARRTGAFAWASDNDGLTLISGDTAFHTIMTAAPGALGRYKYNGVTSASLQLAGYLSSTLGGTIRWTTASGAVVTKSIPIGSRQLVRAAIAIDAEDLSSADGKRASREETITVEVACASAAGAISVHSLTGGEGDATTTTTAALLGLGGSYLSDPQFTEDTAPWIQGGP